MLNQIKYTEVTDHCATCKFVNGKSILFFLISFVFILPVVSELCGDESYLLIAQEKPHKEMIKDKPQITNETQNIKAPNSPQAAGDKVIIKDEGGNSLIEINDEGTFGSITIPDSTGAPGTITNKLYNVNGTLNFNGTVLGSGGAGSINDLSDGKYDGASVFLGEGAGTNDDGTANYNTAVGKNALYDNTTGSYNTATGYYALYSNTTGSHNTANGYGALNSNTTGGYNTATGSFALNYNTTGNYNTANGFYALYKNTTGSYNTANGYYALNSNTTGSYNTANGYYALNYNTTGSYNTVNGYYALYSNTTGAANTANGFYALYKNTTGNYNTVNGYYALYSNTTGARNTANGSFALYSNTTGNYNTANSYFALYSNTTGSYNTATGYYALYSNTTGHYNTANSSYALYSNTTGNRNTAIGYYALYSNTTGYSNTAIGSDALRSNTTGGGNVAIGRSAGYYETGSNKLYIENSSSSTPLIGGDFNADEVYLNAKVGIGTTNPSIKLHVADYASGTEVAIFHNTAKDSDSDGIKIIAGPDTNPGYGVDFIQFQNGNEITIGSIDGDSYGGIRYNTTSDERLKTKIRDYTGALEILTQIKVRKYEKISAPGTERIGMIAQELQKVYPQAVSGSPDSDVNTDPMMVDYGRITPLLIRAIQELQEENEKIKGQNAEYRIRNSEITKRLTLIEEKLNTKRFTASN